MCEEEASSTAGCESAEVAAGRPFGGLLRGFFDFEGVDAIVLFETIAGFRERRCRI